MALRKEDQGTATPTPQSATERAAARGMFAVPTIAPDGVSQQIGKDIPISQPQPGFGVRRALIIGAEIGTVAVGSELVARAVTGHFIPEQLDAALASLTGQPQSHEQGTPPPGSIATPEPRNNTDVTAQYTPVLNQFKTALTENGQTPGNLTATEVTGTIYSVKVDQNGQPIIDPQTGLYEVTSSQGTYVVFKDGDTQIGTYGQYSEGGQKAVRMTGVEGHIAAARLAQDSGTVLNPIVIPNGAEVVVTPFTFNGYHGIRYTWTIDGVTQVVDTFPNGDHIKIAGNRNGLLGDPKLITELADASNTGDEFIHTSDGTQYSGSQVQGHDLYTNVDPGTSDVIMSVHGSPTQLTIQMPDGSSASVELG